VSRLFIYICLFTFLTSNLDAWGKLLFIVRRVKRGRREKRGQRGEGVRTRAKERVMVCRGAGPPILFCPIACPTRLLIFIWARGSVNQIPHVRAQECSVCPSILSSLLQCTTSPPVPWLSFLCLSLPLPTPLHLSSGKSILKKGYRL
jgi:hypothetical protein